MRILITGSGGRLGRLLYAARGLCGSPGLELVFQSRGPDRDVQWRPEDPVDLLPECDALVALWGGTSGTDEDLALNARLVRLTCDVARARNASRVFHLSSAAVYGPGIRMSEEMPTRPLNAYGQAKLDMEAVARATSADLSQSVLRLANIVGADSLGPGLASDKDIYLDRFQDGRGPVRSYIGATDFLKVLCGLSMVDAKYLPFVLNIAAPEPVAMDSLANAAGKTVVWRQAPDHAVQEVSLDPTRMCHLVPSVHPSAEAETLISDLRRLEAMS